MWRKKLLFSAIFSVIFMLPFMVSAAFVSDSDTSNINDLDLYGCYLEAAVYDADGRAIVGCNSSNGIFFYNSTSGAFDSTDDNVGAIGEIADSTNYTFFIGGISAYKVAHGSTDAVVLSEASNVGSDVVANSTAVLFALRDGTLARYDSAGENYSNITVASGVTTIDSMTMATDGTVYVLANNTIYISTDHGATFPNSVAVDSTYEELYVDPADSTYIIGEISDDFFYSATGPNNISTAFCTECTGEAVFDPFETRICIGTRCYDDDGTNQSDYTAPTGYSFRNEGDIAFDPTDTNNMLFEVLGSFAMSADNGTTWSINTTGVYGVTVDRIYQSGAEVWLATDSGLAHTTNFTDSAPTWDFPITVDINFVGAPAVYEYDDVVYAGAGGTIYTSTDDGTTWTSRSSEFGGASAHDIVEDSGVVYVGNNSGVHTTIDGGATWTDLSLSISANTLAFDGSDLYAGGESGIYQYDGSSWTNVYSDGNISDLEVKGGKIFAVGSNPTSGQGVILRSANGTTWNAITPDDESVVDPNVTFQSIVFQNSNNGYVGFMQNAGVSGIIKTTDGGDSWKAFYDGLMDEDFNDMIFVNASTSASSSLSASASNSGLVIGTSTNLYNLTSNAKLTLKRNKKRVKRNRKVTLTGRLKDYATKEGLSKKKAKLYKKHKLSKKWKKLKTKKTNKNGKVIFKRRIKKKTYFRIVFKAKRGSTAAANYGNGSHKSSRVLVRLKKK